MNEKINTQAIQTAYECFGKGDVAGILNQLTTDVTWHVAPVNNVPYTGTRNGHTGAAEFFTSMAEVEDTLKFEPQEFIAQGDKVVDALKRPDANMQRISSTSLPCAMRRLRALLSTPIPPRSPMLL